MRDHYVVGVRGMIRHEAIYCGAWWTCEGDGELILWSMDLGL